MKFKGIPNRLCRITKIKPNLVRKIPKSIRFDKNGVYETENPYLIKRLKTKFEIIGEYNGLQENQEKEEKTEQNGIVLKECSYSELQVMYAEKTGKSAVGKRKVDILKELEV